MASTTDKSGEVIVIGGGAAGIVAARRAAERGAAVTLLEKNDRLGLKILISGGGKCNLTHDGPMEEVRAKFRANEGRFLKPAFYKFTNADFLEILHTRSMATYTRPDGRVFPTEPANAKDVVALLTRYIEEAGVRIQYGAAVMGLVAEAGAMTGVRLSDPLRFGEGGEERAGRGSSGGTFLPASRVIVATGGSSYPATGTTGDAWAWLTALGHTLVPLRAALAPLYLRDPLPEHSGVALRDAVLRARVGPGGKELTRWRGDVLLTHKGVSGPTALGIARDVADYHAEARTTAVLEADLVPDQPFEAVQATLRGEIRDNPRRTAAGLVSPYVPARLVDPLLAAAGVDGATRGAHLPIKSLNKLVTTLKGWPLGDVRHIPLERGEVVAGGIALDEVDPQTMQSRLVRGLSLCGEVLDIAGPVGGYNLQAAWSTGFVAGDSVAF